VRQTADSSIAIPALLDGHPAHDEAADALAACAATIAHVAIEIYSVLTRLPPPSQADATTTAEVLDDHSSRAGEASNSGHHIQALSAIVGGVSFWWGTATR
jgi:hypothetical protein